LAAEIIEPPMTFLSRREDQAADEKLVEDLPGLGYLSLKESLPVGEPSAQLEE
jgi:hypothetical protein